MGRLMSCCGDERWSEEWVDGECNSNNDYIR